MDTPAGTIPIPLPIPSTTSEAWDTAAGAIPIPLPIPSTTARRRVGQTEGWVSGLKGQKLILKGAEPGRIEGCGNVCAHSQRKGGHFPARAACFCDKNDHQRRARDDFGGEKYIKNTTNC